MRCWMVAAIFVAAGSAAFAAGYDDYMRGYEARRAGNFEAALTAFTAALADGDLAPTYQPDAHIGRADALMHKRKCAEAAADLDAALSLRPKTVEALMLRANANSCLGKPDAALADIDAAIAVAPSTGLYATRADFHWFRGEFATAAADYLQAAKLQPKRAYEPRQGIYSLLWYAISAARAKTYDAAVFAAAAHDLDVDEDDWPGPLMGFIRGKTKREDVYREAARGDGVVPVHKKCQADFFIGEWQVANGDPAGRALLQGMEQSCPKEAAVLYDARRDLKRLP
jgi:tetratricopeptide (TPR) repeat protein